MSPSLAERLGFGPTQPAAKPPALTAAAHVLRLGRDRIVKQEQNWQVEAWGFYERLGEFTEGVDWPARALSRVRLIPAEFDPLANEPTPVESGPMVDLLAELGAGEDGHAQMLRTLAVLFAVPGEGWLTGESTDAGIEWVVRSTSEVRDGKTKNSRGETIPEVIDDASATANRLRWRPLAPLDGENWFIAKLWVRDKQYRHLASSPAKAALADLRRLELVNRRIDAELLSRLAMNGLLLFPNEVTFPIRPEFADEPDPFAAEFLTTGTEAIQTPGTAAAYMPIPVKVPGEWLDKIKHLTFSNPLDEKLLETRTALVRSIATTLDMPAEYLTGIGDLNHWSLSQLGEDAVKEYIAPRAELMVHTLTQAVRPLLGDSEQARKQVIWYDLSELVQRPDRSEAARDAYDRLELSPGSYRREVGFDEDDKPTDEERKQMVLLALTRGTEAGRAAEEMGVLEPAPVPVMVPGQPPGQPADKPRPVNGPPDTRDAPPPAPDADVPVAASANGRKP